MIRQQLDEERESTRLRSEERKRKEKERERKSLFEEERKWEEIINIPGPGVGAIVLEVCIFAMMGSDE